LCNVGFALKRDMLLGVVVHDDAHFAAVVIVDDASADVEVTESETAARFYGASDRGWVG